MKKELCSYTALIGFLSLVVLLTFVTFGQAQDIEKWTGSVSFSLKLTTATEDTSGNRKLGTSNETFAGTMNLYWDTKKQGPEPGPDGCILELLGNDGTKICFNDMMGTTSLTVKSGKSSAVFVGTGNIATTVQGHGDTGPVYINGKGSQVLDSSGNPISGSFGGAIGGGYSSDQGTIFTGTIPTTALTK